MELQAKGQNADGLGRFLVSMTLLQALPAPLSR